MPKNKTDLDDYQPIDWAAEFKKQPPSYRPIQDMMQHDFPTIDAALSFSPQTLEQVYALATRQLSACPEERLDGELTKLRQYLSSLLPEVHAPHDNFHRDFARLAYFIYMEQNLETVSDNSLWGVLDFSSSEDRYREVVEILLAQKIRRLTDSDCTNINALSEELENYEQLARRLNGDVLTLTDDTKSSFSAHLLAWLYKIWDFFKSFLSRRDASHYAGDDQVILKLLKLVRQSENYDDGFNKLSAWYVSRAKQCEPRTKYWEDALNQEKEQAETPPLPLWRKVTGWHNNTPPNYKQLTEALKRELGDIERWTSCMFKSIWVNSSGDPATLATLVERHLDVYMQMQTQLQSWQARAVSIRMHREERLRNINTFSRIHSGNYLTQLNAIDEELLALYSNMKQIAHKAADAAEQFAHDAYVNTLKKANETLFEIEAPIENLERIYWVEHTCYAFRDTEGHVAYELEARNKMVHEACFYHYDLDRVYTISDKMMDAYLEFDRPVKQLTLKVAPDKHSTEGEKPLRCIFEYCIRRVNTLRKDAQEISELWQLGQWRILSNDATIEANIDTLRLTHRVTHVEKPTSQLRLSVLLMLQEHRSLIDKGGSLFREKATATSILNHFYTKKEPEHRAMFRWMKDHFDEIGESVKFREAEVISLTQKQAAAEQKQAIAEQKQAAAEQKQAAAEQKAEEARTQRLASEQKTAQQAAESVAKIAALEARLAAITSQQPPLHHASPIHVASAPDIDSQPSVQSTQGFSQ